jgi:hypothetical protein
MMTHLIEMKRQAGPHVWTPEHDAFVLKHRRKSTNQLAALLNARFGDIFTVRMVEGRLWRLLALEDSQWDKRPRPS